MKAWDALGTPSTALTVCVGAGVPASCVRTSSCFHGAERLTSASGALPVKRPQHSCCIHDPSPPGDEK